MATPLRGGRPYLSYVYYSIATDVRFSNSNHAWPLANVTDFCFQPLIIILLLQIFVFNHYNCYRFSFSTIYRFSFSIILSKQLLPISVFNPGAPTTGLSTGARLVSGLLKSYCTAVFQILAMQSVMR